MHQRIINIAEQTVEMELEGPAEELSWMMCACACVSVSVGWVSDRLGLTERMSEWILVV